MTTTLPVRFLSAKDELAALVRIRRIAHRLDVRVSHRRHGWWSSITLSGHLDDVTAAVNATRKVLAAWEAGEELAKVPA